MMMKDLLIKSFVLSLGGQDASTSYKEHLAQNVAQKLGVAVLCVDYHGVGNRGWLGGKTILDPLDAEFFKASCETVGFKLDDDFFEHTEDEKYIVEVLEKLHLHIGLLKLSGKAKMDYHMILTFTTIPREKEYQNFGIMSACDILNALFYIGKNPPFKTNSTYLPCVLVGSSHGGYIANLAAKIAPWAIEAIVDNGSWSLKTFMFDNEDFDYQAFKAIGFAREIDFNLIRFVDKRENFYYLTSDKTHWGADPHLPNYFSRSRFEIRDPGYKEHLKEQSKIKKAIYVCYHVVKDDIAPYFIKEDFYKELKELGFNSTLYPIKDESQIDGKLIKHLGHGAGMSIQELILREVPALIKKIKNEQEYKGKKEISYVCDDLIYTFKQVEEKIILDCHPV